MYYTYVYTYIHTYIHTYIRTYIHIYVCNTYIHTDILPACLSTLLFLESFLDVSKASIQRLDIVNNRDVT